MKYNRYMVFVWSEFDNQPPFDCIDGHYDDKDDAIRHAMEITDSEYCIFDRESGVFIDTFNN